MRGPGAVRSACDIHVTDPPSGSCKRSFRPGNPEHRHRVLDFLPVTEPPSGQIRYAGPLFRGLCDAIVQSIVKACNQSRPTSRRMAPRNLRSRGHEADDHHSSSHMPGKRHLPILSGGWGRPVVLLHGFPETSFAWRFRIPALSRYYRVIAPPFRQGSPRTGRSPRRHGQRSDPCDDRNTSPNSAMVRALA